MTSDLIEIIDGLSIDDVDQWVSGLSTRKQEEARFHDRLRDMAARKEIAGTPDFQQQFGNSKFLGTDVFCDNERYFDETALSRNIGYLSDKHFHNTIQRSVKNKTVLDMACGFGREGILAGLWGASLVVGIDVSAKSIEEAKRLAKRKGVQDRTRFLVADCESTGLPSEGFDVIICARMLHHVDFEATLIEASRLMRPGGRVISIEALGHNPVINWYRNHTPSPENRVGDETHPHPRESQS